jgi:hypothetical protein
MNTGQCLYVTNLLASVRKKRPKTHFTVCGNLKPSQEFEDDQSDRLKAITVSKIQDGHFRIIKLIYV